MNSSFTKALLAILIAVFLVGFFVIGMRFLPKRELPDSSGSTNRISRELADQLAQLEAREIDLNNTVWKTEMLAQQCGAVFESLWDSINAAANKLDVAASLAFEELVLGDWTTPRSLENGIEVRKSTGTGITLSPARFRDLVEQFENAGWKLVQTEFRQNQFEPDKDGSPKRSRFYFSAHLVNHTNPDRAIVDGTIVVDWMKSKSPKEAPGLRRIDVSGLTVKSRKGEPPFQLILSEIIPPPQHSYSIDPLLVYDLDGDGLSELTLAAKNLTFRGRGGNRYEKTAFCRMEAGLIYTGVIADFNGDGFPDFLAANTRGLILFRGTRGGVFDEPARSVWTPTSNLDHPMVLTCGDIDADWDLDVFLGQYKVPYKNGQLPTPFHDANDGHPSFLLRNNGHGDFVDATESSGLGTKQRRRCYSASFADIDRDDDLDLIVVSDFAGADLYQNDGTGRFSDITKNRLPNPHAFGMGHVLSDFNSDGLVDFLQIGMTSPTADRLNHLGLRHPEASEDVAMRFNMTYGNRLSLGTSKHHFEQTPLNDSIARSGWSWGCGAFDFNNDGYVDAYIANGLESRESVKDYESEYWLHDRHVGRSSSDSAVYLYFGAKFSRTRGRGHSYGGYEKNRFYLNQQGNSFLEVAHLLGIALEEDSRNVVSDDLDGDGRVDLLVTSFEAWPESKQTLRVYRNTLTGAGNWIGFRFREATGGHSPTGVTVRIHYDGGVQVRKIVTGDSYRSQHANTVHFGLGKSSTIEKAEIIWPVGKRATLNSPHVNRYHWVHGVRNSETADRSTSVVP